MSKKRPGRKPSPRSVEAFDRDMKTIYHLRVSIDMFHDSAVGKEASRKIDELLRDLSVLRSMAA